MKLKDIIIPGIVGAGISAFAAGAGEASAEGLQSWQIDNSNKNQITIHIKKGDTLDEIARDLDKRIGRYDDPNDLGENLKWFTKNGYIIETDCGNPLKNPNLIQAGEDYSFIGLALKAIDPDYGKQDITNIENKPKITEKDIQVKTESKTRKRGERSLMSDISRVKDYNNKDKNRIGRWVLNGGIEYAILEGAGEEFGNSAVFDINFGYQVPGIGFAIGGRMSGLDGNEYKHYRNSVFGFSYEEQEEERDLTVTELYAQLKAGSNTFKVFGGVGMISIGDIREEEAYGWWEGESSLNREYDRYAGYFGGLELMLPLGESKEVKLDAGVTARYGKYKTDDGLKLNATSAGVKIEAIF